MLYLLSTMNIQVLITHAVNKNVTLMFFIFQGLKHFDEILQEADGIILSRGNLGIDLPPEKVSFVT